MTLTTLEGTRASERVTQNSGFHQVEQISGYKPVSARDHANLIRGEALDERTANLGPPGFLDLLLSCYWSARTEQHRHEFSGIVTRLEQD